jgi:BASS family bile acid:Na+ symporter
MQALLRLSHFVGKTFAVWVLLFAALAFASPATFRPLAAWVVPLLGVIMFGMGLTLSKEDFRAVVRQRWQVLIGCLRSWPSSAPSWPPTSPRSPPPAC